MHASEGKGAAEAQVHLQAALHLIHSFAAPAKAAKHAAGQLLGLGVPQNHTQRCLHLHNRTYIRHIRIMIRL